MSSGSSMFPPNLDPWPLDSRAWTSLLISFSVMVAVGLALGWFVVTFLESTAAAEWDRGVTELSAASREATLTAWSDFASALSSTPMIISLLTISVGGLVWKLRRWREPLTLLMALGLETSVFIAVSWAIGRARPPVEQLDPSPPTASFPSGHVGAAVAFYGGWALVIFWNTESLLWRALALVWAAGIPSAVALSRIYRGMHYPSDVLVGAALGALSLAVSAIIVGRGVARSGAAEP